MKPNTAHMTMRLLLPTAVGAVGWVALASSQNAGPPDGWEPPALNAGGEAPYVHKINLYDAEGAVIDPKTSTDPYSPSETCGKCHDVAAINHGWHFNAGAPDFEGDGRVGEPWWWADSRTQTQLPISARDWPGPYKLEEVGLTPWSFTLRFGAFTPGGGMGDALAESVNDPEARWSISGKLTVDCLACHLNNHDYDQEAWAKAIEAQNFKWAPTAAAPFARVKGEAKNLPDDYDPEFDLFGENEDLPVVEYVKELFDPAKRIHLDIVARTPNDSCYRCHSQQHVGAGAQAHWLTDNDVHVARGMDCVDCHRHGLNHMVSRSDEHDPLLQTEPGLHTLTCDGCHGGEGGGRFASPKPKHAGIPPLHFDKMACTACHSGPVPGDAALLTQTSMAHKLGLSSEHRSSATMPHIVSPLFVRDQFGKLAAHRGAWPAYWGRIDEQGEVAPLPVAEIESKVAPLLPKPKHEDEWQPLTDEQVIAVLKALGDNAVYVSAGTARRLDGGKLADMDGVSFAQPITWPMAHDVRPAAQSLGVNGCTDCHADNAAIDFAMAYADGPPQAGVTVSTTNMHELRTDDALRTSLWNQAFRGRPLFKVIVWVSVAAVTLVVVTALLVGVRRLLLGEIGGRDA